jgi:hypothetical protein
VEVDPYGTNAVRAQFANVVAYKYAKTDTSHPLWLGTGGHYDMVSNTIDAALDDTAGTLSTLAIAKALANVTTTHNIVYGLWGGEESGLQGSEFFTRTNPSIVAQMQMYVNLDANAFSWPGPQAVAKDGSTPDCSKPPLPAQQTKSAAFFCPDPALITAGPDGPMADKLLNLMRSIQQKTAVGWPDPYFLYEYVGQGQVQGYAKINAQSDHTSFIAAGVPSYMLINADLEIANPPGFHNPRDTLDNWTKYEVFNAPFDLEAELTPQERALGERLVAQSIETYLWLTFYAFLSYDLALLNAPVGTPVQ